MLTAFQRQVVQGLEGAADENAASVVVKQAILQMRMQRFGWPQIERFWEVVAPHTTRHHLLIAQQLAAARES